jgi:hypothetical protein
VESYDPVAAAKGELRGAGLDFRADGGYIENVYWHAAAIKNGHGDLRDAQSLLWNGNWGYMDLAPGSGN